MRPPLLLPQFHHSPSLPHYLIFYPKQSSKSPPCPTPTLALAPAASSSSSRSDSPPSPALFLIYRPITPRYNLISLSLCGNLTAFPSSFHPQIENENKHMGIYHDPIALSISPRGKLTAAVPGFYQGYKKTAEKYGNFTGGGGEMRKGVVGVRVESGCRLKVLFWKTRRREVRVGGDVEIEDGKMTAEKGIRLSSGSGRRRCRWVLMAVTLFTVYGHGD